MAPKRKAASHSDDEDATPKSKGKKQPTKAIGSSAGDNGWTIEPPSLIYRLTDGGPAKKIAAFDLDGTLATTKKNTPFAMGPDDYKIFNKKVSKIIQGFVEDGYRIVVFSNQNGIKAKLDGKAAINAKQRADNIMAEIKVPATIFFATLKDEYRKPEVGMWERFVKDFNGGVQPDLKESFFVGDAAGRPGDHSDSDKAFADAIGIPFMTPEEVFGEGLGKKAAPVKKDEEASGENQNQELCDALKELAQIAAAAGEIYPARAYETAAKSLAAWPVKITSGKEGMKLSGIGKGCAAKIDEFMATGTLEGLSDEPRPVAKSEGGDGGNGGSGGSNKKQKGARTEAAEMASKFL